jgi:hypothetical protein
MLALSLTERERDEILEEVHFLCKSLDFVAWVGTWLKDEDEWSVVG